MTRIVEKRSSYEKKRYKKTKRGTKGGVQEGFVVIFQCL